MTEDLRRLADDLDARGEPYVLATVVAVERPVSARPSDQAVVFTDGRLRGWVGGSCSQPIVIREAMAALADGNPRLVRIRPPGSAREDSRPGVVTEITACASEGGLDVFVQPHRARPRIAVVGSSPVSRTLAELAATVGYRVVAVFDDPSEQVPRADATAGLDGLIGMDLGPGDAVVVATMNRYDEEALLGAVETNAGYIGLVASRMRGKHALELVASRGVDEAQLRRVRFPAGLDLGPSSQEEIALAVLAEVVSEHHKVRHEDARGPVCPEPIGEQTDPVCGMSVAAVAGAITAVHGGRTYYFCCPGCRVSFLSNPTGYVKVSGL